MLKIFGFLLITGMLIVGCEKNYDDKISSIENHFKKGRTGKHSSDYFLVKNTLFIPEKVAVIFGFIDNSSFCEDIAMLYVQKYPEDRYYCTYAND